MAQLNVNGTTLEYTERGSGPPLVLVHGSAFDYRSWDLQQEALAEHFRAISYSRRYHWPNEPIGEGSEYSMDEQVDDLQALLTELDAAPAHLVGQSAGGVLCLLLAMRQPSLVRTLVLAEPGVVTLFVPFPPKPLDLLKLLMTRPRIAVGLFKLGARGLDPAMKTMEQGDLETGVRKFVDAVLGPGGFDRLPEERQVHLLNNAAAVKAELFGPGPPPLDAGEVQRVKAPTLLLTGERSLGLFHRLTESLGELLPQANQIEIPDASHGMHLDNASAFNAAVLSFLDNYRSG